MFRVQGKGRSWILVLKRLPDGVAPECVYCERYYEGYCKGSIGALGLGCRDVGDRFRC